MRRFIKLSALSQPFDYIAAPINDEPTDPDEWQAKRTRRHPAGFKELGRYAELGGERSRIESVVSMTATEQMF